MRVRLAGVSDLIAAEGKYHKKCLAAYKYQTGKKKEESKKTDIALIFLCSELRYAAQFNQILQLNDVWMRYTELAEETNIEIPPSFISRRTSFKEKLMQRVGDLFQFVQPLTRDISEREPLLVPHKYSHEIIADSFYQGTHGTNDVELLSIAHYEPQEDDFLSLIHVALKIRRELIDTPGHQGFEVSKDAAVSCVPDSLYMFLNVLLGGGGGGGGGREAARNRR